MVAYVAESVASAPPPRGLPLAALAPARNSAAAPVAVTSAPHAGGGEAGNEWAEAIAPSDAGVPTGEEDGPPLEELEAQMRVEVAASDATQQVRKPRPKAPSGDDNDAEAEGGRVSGPLPELDALLGRVPPEVRETVEELLRVRFAAVKRVPAKALVAASGSKP
ncbi:MAG: hypothetical protein RL376_1000 [Verrucomicrobiota bacterium]